MNDQGVVYILRKLNRSEAELLCRVIRLDSNIAGYSVSDLMSFETVLIAEVDDEFIGAAIMLPVSLKCKEIAVVSVIEKFRGLGIGKELFSKAIVSSRKDFDIYCVSRNQVVISWMRSSGFEIVSNWIYLPLRINVFNLKWALNWYRLSEVIRKNFLSRSKKSFVIGILYSKVSNNCTNC